jgi:preprotein translocase subunit SecD
VLITLLVIAVALVGLMFWQGLKTPKLALDLAGGTTVTLTAEPAKAGAKIGDSEMSQAISIMRERVNGLGVSEAEVTKQGSNVIIVQVPGQGQKRVVDTIGTTAKLEFRQVMVAEPVGVPQQPAPPPATPTPTPSGKASKSPKPSGSATPSGKASPTPKGRALAQALTAETPKPSSKPSGKATPASSASQTPTPEQLQQQQQLAQLQAQQQQAGAEDFSGVDPAVKAQFDKLTCTGNDVGQGVTLNPAKQAAICARPDPKTHKSDY